MSGGACSSLFARPGGPWDRRWAAGRDSACGGDRRTGAPMPEAFAAASSTRRPPICRMKAPSPAAKFSPDGGGDGEGDGRRHVRLDAEGGAETGDRLRPVGDAAKQDGGSGKRSGKILPLTFGMRFVIITAKIQYALSRVAEGPARRSHGNLHCKVPNPAENRKMRSKPLWVRVSSFRRSVLFFALDRKSGKEVHYGKISLYL